MPLLHLVSNPIFLRSFGGFIVALLAWSAIAISLRESGLLYSIQDWFREAKERARRYEQREMQRKMRQPVRKGESWPT